MQTLNLLAVSDAFWLFLGVVLNALIVALVAPLILRRLARMEKMGATTHSLVNSAMTDELRRVAVSARELAVSKPNKKNIAKAEAAELALAEHEAAGKRADAVNGHAATTQP